MIDVYIPAEIMQDARNFIDEISDDVEMYQISKSVGLIGCNFEADAFVSFWLMQGYAEKPECLFLLYENRDYIESCFGLVDEQNINEFYVFRFVMFYRLLLDNGCFQ